MGKKSVNKAVTVDQLFSLVQPSFISPLLFASNLLIYSVTCSKLDLTVCDKLHPADNKCIASSLWRHSYSIDNDQVFIKKWTVRKDNGAQINVLTSVCVAPIHPNGTLQWNSDLAQGDWDSCVYLARTSEEERARLWDLCCASEADKEVIDHENKKMINELLQDVLKEQTKTGGEWKDDIDLPAI
ncbi:PREDICTED: uncharacterized protein LOC107348290 [Acropora digitifera]|uniref:uncharacterized protein LOC107348290 n=1 Tax=Acropora digitifera TaxID=70779 RepID=UPI00077ACE28|nr:PREDICTED: uncharacterized protein LOC107348290 [Acropora digitifera]